MNVAFAELAALCDKHLEIRDGQSDVCHEEDLAEFVAGAGVRGTSLSAAVTGKKNYPTLRRDSEMLKQW